MTEEKAGKEKITKIVFLGRYNPSEELSGPEKVSKRIFAEHTKKNKSSFIQYFFDGRKFSIRQKLFGCEERQLTDNSEVITAGIFKIYSILRKEKPDIIHIIMYERFAIIAVLYKIFNNVKIIFNMHGIAAYENSHLKRTSFFYKMKDKFCEKLIVTHSNKILFTSREALDIAERHYLLNDDKMVIIANGIDNIFHNGTKTKLPQKLRAVFIFSNELYNTGLNFLKDYISRAPFSFELYIITRFNTGINAIHTPPMQANELKEFYKDKDIFLGLNSYDTFSISAGEAMASGLVPVITQQTGISRFIENGHNGFTVNYGNVNELDNAIKKYISLSDADKISVSKNASVVYNELKWDNIYSAYVNIYNSVRK